MVSNFSNSINICIACDDNYSKYAGVVIASILANSSKKDNLSFYILDGGISNQKKDEINSLKSIKDCEINFIHIDDSFFEDYKCIKTHEYISIAACYRLKLPTLLPDVKRVIYLDCDTVANASLSPLFNADLEHCPLGGVLDINKRMLKKNPEYVNSGVLVMDLDRMREQNIEAKLLEWTKENINNIKTGDQEIINEVCKGNIRILDDAWNVQSSNFTNRSSYTLNPKIIHFVSKKKPWHYASFSYHRDYYFKYLQMTPWRLSENDLKHWLKDNQIDSLIGYLKYRPFFMLRPRFYSAIYQTYIKRIFESKKPIIKDNTFIVWEPCSKSHAEVVPGYAKYLLDLGYNVSVIVDPARFKEGLFARFKSENLFLNKLTKKEVQKYFQNSDLSEVEGLLVTTLGKLCDSVHFDDCYAHFAKNVDKSKLFLVAHEAKAAADRGAWRNDLITLRELDYKGIESIVVNPHYFGNIKVTPKNNDIVNFITIGALQDKKKNCKLIIDSVKKLHDSGYRNFKITVIGKGSLKGFPNELRTYFDIKGRLPFDKMYDEIEKADFMLTSYNENDPAHIRYNTTGTSGNFQLVYGFVKPCVIIESFAPINGFNSENAVLYNSDSDYADAMMRAIDMKKDDYSNLQHNLQQYSNKLYDVSKVNLTNLIQHRVYTPI